MVKFSVGLFAIITLLSPVILIWQRDLEVFWVIAKLGYFWNFFFFCFVLLSLVFVIYEKKHILIGCQLKVQLNISESERTFEVIPFLFLLLQLWFFSFFFLFDIYLFTESINKFNVSFRWCQLSIVNVNDDPVELHSCLQQICEKEMCCCILCRCLWCGNLFTQRIFS